MIEYVLKYKKVTILFIVMAMLVGSLSFTLLPRKENPEISLTVARVQTIYPGASPEMIEKLVTKPLEEKIKDIEEVIKIQSTSTINVSTIMVEIVPGSVEDNRKVWNELKQKVQSAEADLPSGSHKPVVNDNLGKIAQQIYQFIVDSTDELEELRSISNEWQEELSKVQGVSDVEIVGLPKQEVSVYLDVEKINQLQLPWGIVIQAIDNSYNRVPLGSIQEKGSFSLLQLEGEWNSISDVENIVVFHNGQLEVLLKDIAKIEISNTSAHGFVLRNGKPALSIVVNSNSGVDILSLQKSIEEKVVNLKEQLPATVEVVSEFSQKESVDSLFSSLGIALLMGIIMVIIICSLGLSLSTAILVATVIPLSAAIGFIPFDLFGVELNQITIVALIIVLGILVDDAVVLNDNIERRLYNGDTPHIAALEGTREVFVSLMTATLATVSAFFPLFFMQGNIGNFIKPLPVVITVMMFSSLLVSITVIPILRQWISERFKGKGERKNRKQVGVLGGLIHKLSLNYEVQIQKSIKRPLLTVLLALLLGTSSYAVLPFIGVQFFPKAERDVFLIDFKLPADSSIDKTNETLTQAAEWLLDKEGVEVVTAYIGRNTPKFYYSEQMAYGENIGQLFVKINKNDVNTTELLQPIREELQAQFSDVEIIPRELEQGPPVGAPIAVRIIGDDLTKLKEVSQEIKKQLKEIDGAVNVSDDMGVNMQVVSINPSQEKLSANAVSEKDLSMSIRLISEGIKVASLNQGNELYEVMLRVDNALFDSTEAAIKNLYIPSANGKPVVANELVTVERKEAIKSIQRENNNRIVNVRSYTDGRLPDEILRELKERIDNIRLPEGYNIQFGGENEQREEAFYSIAKLWIVVIMLIYILMVWQFNSFIIPFIILTTVYLAFGGSLIGLFISNSHLGFMALMGAVSLSGIVVRNGVILIEFIQQERRLGRSLYEAVSNAGKVRLRPILLTSFTAVGALLPLAISGGSLFQPMAISIISGLLYSTFLTLIVVPALYVLVANWFERSNKEKQTMKKTAI